MNAGPEAGFAAVAGRLDRATVVPYLREILRRAARIADETLIRRDFSVAGMALKLRFSDAALARVYAERLAFPVAEAGDDAVRIDVLEAAALGWPAPLPWGERNWSTVAFDAALAAAGLRGVYAEEPAPGAWHSFDVSAGHALQLAWSRATLPVWDAGAPLRLPLHWAAAQQGAHLVHAATLGDRDGGVLIAGPGGAGKSGTTLAGIAGGLGTVGDDYVIVRAGEPPVAYPAYRLLKQDRKGIARFPGLAERLGPRSPNWQGKIEFDPTALFPGCLRPSLPLRAVLLATIARQPRTTIAPMEAGQAFRAFVPAALNQLGTGTVAGFTFFGDLLRRLPTYRLSLSQDPAEIAQAIRAFLEERAG